MLALFMSISLATCAGATPQKSNQTQEIRAQKINSLLSQADAQSESLNDILQYLGSSIATGSIAFSTPAEKQKAQQWISNHQRSIRDAQKALHDPIDEKQLATFSRTLKHLLNLSLEAMDDKLTDLEIAPLPDLTVRSAPSLEALEKDIQAQELLLAQVRAKANIVGLTKINLLARKLDQLNNKYHLTTIASVAALTTILTSAFLYIIPKETIDNLPWWMMPIKKLKQLIGSRPEIEKVLESDPKTTADATPDAQKKNRQRTKEEVSNADDLGFLGKLEAQLPKVFREPVALALGAATVAQAKALLENTGDKYSADLSREWQKLKGYTVAENRSKARVYDDLTLDDERLIGLEEAKRILKGMALYVTDPEAFDRSGTNPSRSILLLGPSGTGKTFLAKALSGTINKALQAKDKNTRFGFIEVKWHEIVWSGDGIKSVIEKAKRQAPCVLFIDELHNLPLQNKGQDETLSLFLTGLSGINDNNDTKHQIILLAATNRPELLDPAILRSGRLGDTIIRLEKPNYEQRKDYFAVMFKINSIDCSTIDMDDLVRKTQGATFADLEAVFKNARYDARKMAQGVSQKHLVDNIESNVLRIKKDLPLTQQEKRLIAVHQAGHALMYLLPETKPQAELDAVTIYGIRRKIYETHTLDQRARKDEQHEEYQNSRVKYGAVFTYHPAERLKIKTADDLIKQCKIKLAGALAEELILGTRSNYHEKDAQKAFSMVKSLLLKGRDEKSLSEEKQSEIADASLQLVEQYEKEVLELLKQHQERLKKIADALCSKHTLTAKEITQL